MPDHRPEEANAEVPRLLRAVDASLLGSIILVIITALLYLFSPIDAVPDFIPMAGQADDVVAIAAGGGTVSFLTLMRVILSVAIKTPKLRKGCLFVLLVVTAAFGVLVLLALVGAAALLGG